MEELIEFIRTEYKWFLEYSPPHGVVPVILAKAEEILEKEKLNKHLK